jgi:hypothetical protein
MPGSKSPKEAWDTYVGADVTVADFLGRIGHSTPGRGEGIENLIDRYLAGQGSAEADRSEACRLIAEYISQTDQPAA